MEQTNYIDRMREELAEVAERYAKLVAFIYSEKFYTLCNTEKQKLMQQQDTTCGKHG